MAVTGLKRLIPDCISEAVRRTPAASVRKQ